MTIEKFYDTLSFILDIDKKLRLQSTVETIAASLVSLVQSPANPPQQQALANALESFDSVSTSLAHELTPSDKEVIEEVGGADFFDPALASAVRASVGTNAMTPSVARDYVQDFATRRASFLATVKETLSGLEKLGVSGREAKAGTADLAFVIPRELFNNKLDSFAKELAFFNRLVEHISEASTGKAEVAVLEGLSSSTPTVSILADIDVIFQIAGAVNGFLDAWKKVQDFRDARSKLTELGISGKAIEEVNERITTIVEEVVETTTTTILQNYNRDSGRRNELESALRQDARRLFGQIERGLIVQVRAEPAEDEPDASAQQALEQINEIGRNLSFPKVDAAPLLLASGEIIEGDLTIVHSTKSTKKTTKKTTVKA